MSSESSASTVCMSPAPNAAYPFRNSSTLGWSAIASSLPVRVRMVRPYRRAYTERNAVLGDGLDDPGAAEELIPPVHHDALARRHPALRRAELHTQATVRVVHDGGHVAAVVTDPDLGLERSDGGRLAGHPRDAVGHEASSRQEIAGANDHAVGPGVDLHDVRPFARRDPDTATLPDGEPERPPMATDHGAIAVDHFTLANQ